MDNAVSKLVGQVYEATLDRTLWPKVLTDLSALTGARGAHILLFDRENQVAFGEIGKLPAECHQEYAEQYATLDPRTKRAAAWPDHVLWRDEDLMTEDELRQSPTHHELFRKFDIHRAIGLKNRVDGHGWFTAVLTNWPGGPAFCSDHVSLFEAIYPHLERAARIGTALAPVDLVGRAALDAADELDFGFLICDRRGRIRFANRYAEAVLTTGNGLTVVAGSVVARVGSENAALYALLNSASADSEGGECCVTFGDGRLTMVAVVPSHTALSLFAAEPLAVVLFRSPTEPRTRAFESLRDRYGLTPAEARLVSALIEGSSLAEFAVRAGIRRETVRSLVKQAMAKTGTNRQGQLIARILNEELPITSCECRKL